MIVVHDLHILEDAALTDRAVTGLRMQWESSHRWTQSYLASALRAWWAGEDITGWKSDIRTNWDVTHEVEQCLAIWLGTWKEGWSALLGENPCRLCGEVVPTFSQNEICLDCTIEEVTHAS